MEGRSMWPLVLALASLLGQCAGDAGYLLPGDVIPNHYDLKVTYDIDPATNFSYFGAVDILITCKKPTSKIVLHAKDLLIDDLKTSLMGTNDNIMIVGVELNSTYDFLNLKLSQDLVANENYTLTIPFHGNVKFDLDGVYMSSYFSKAGDKRKKEYLLTTQFEAISARKGFPSFDEPKYKATFSVVIGHHRDFTAVSNMPLDSSFDDNVLDNVWSWSEMSEKFKKDQSSFVWDRFQTSVPMSTYLLAFVVSKFGYVESPKELSTTKFRIWARKDALQQAQYASTIGPKVLTFFEKWFNVSFPLPKQDMIAIPDFSAGAMENWGLITYRETALLYDVAESSFTAKERVAEVVAHELAHQWFGNLVTMSWWSDLWLNEGFATFAGARATAAAEPAWGAARAAAAADLRQVLLLDALDSSHPVSVPIDDPSRIQEIFDVISYKKGAVLIRMMTMFVGEEYFREAIHNYLVKYSYQNAAQDDLWQELTDVTRAHALLSRDVTVKQIMDTWTTQTGYPLLTVERDYSGNTLAVTQKRFFSLGSKFDSASWWVPLNIMCEGDEGKGQSARTEWLSDKEGVTAPQVYEHRATDDQWVLLNRDMIGPYRVNYDARNWQLVSAALRREARGVPAPARLLLLEDALALAWTDRMDYDAALRLVSYLDKETEYLPLEAGLGALKKIELVLMRTPDYGAFQKFIRKLITPTYERAGGLYVRSILDGDDLNSVKMQMLTSRWACRMNVVGCEDNAIAMFKEWMEVENPDVENPIPLDLRSIVYCVAMSRGSVQEWRFLFERYQNTNVAAAKTSALQALACTKEVWILKQYLEWCVGAGGEVRRQDAGGVLAAVARAPVGHYLARDFLYRRLDDVYNAFSGQSRRLGGVIKAVVEQFTTQEELDEFLAWRKENDKYLSEAKLAVSQAVETAQNHISWMKRNRKLVVEKMRQFSQ